MGQDLGTCRRVPCWGLTGLQSSVGLAWVPPAAWGLLPGSCGSRSSSPSHSRGGHGSSLPGGPQENLLLESSYVHRQGSDRPTMLLPCSA